MPRIIVLGNEKGGSGKSTTALHVIVALLSRGYTVGAIDLDARQGSLSRAIENREAYARAEGITLALPQHRRLHRSQADTRSEAESQERTRLEQTLGEFGDLDFIVIDTPGSDSFLSRLGHSYADILVTPLNDSFLDLDLLGRFDVDGQNIISPSIYSQMVWEQRQRRALMGLPPTDWVVMRNRLAHIDARNKRDIARLLDILSQRIRFRIAPGFGERVIFRELFPKGLTLLDLRTPGAGVAMSMSHIAARQEVRELLRVIGLPEPAEAVAEDETLEPARPAE